MGCRVPQLTAPASSSPEVLIGFFLAYIYHIWIGSDGVMPQMFPSGLEDFAELILPELPRRGLARSDYDGPTLRDNLGLKIPIHPAHRFRVQTP